MRSPRLAARLALLAPLVVLACRSEPAGEPKRPRTDFGYPMDTVLRMNHVQAKGTHNSYHVESPGNSVPDWHYTHTPLDVQLDQEGVRAFELDTRFIHDDGAFEVFHLTTLDEGTTCRRFVECLGVLKAWSDRHPGHAPLSVMIEPKDLPPDDDPEGYFTEMEREITSVWPRDWIVTPDDVQGSAPTLHDAVTTRGWPTLAEVRGTVYFFVNDEGAFRDKYSRGDTSLRGRLLFVQAKSQDDPLAAIFVLNNATKDAAAIRSAAAAGFIVRTFSDGEAPVDLANVDAALGGGAHVVSSDHTAPTADSSFVLALPGGTPSRCNPVTAPADCTSLAIEDPARLGNP